MRYVVDVGGTRVDVDLDGEGTRVDGERVVAHLGDVKGTPVRLLTVGHRTYRVVAQPGDTRGTYTLWVDGWRFPVEALDERTRAIRDHAAASAPPAGPAPVLAPMPGMIVRVTVDVGDEVVAGAPVAVIEAMKMENELRAPGAGRVAAVRVKPGQAVEKGAVLVELE